MPYVYELVVIPDEIVCYVGKGSKARMYAHKKVMRRGTPTQSRLYRKLRELLEQGKDFEPRKVFEHEDHAVCIAEEERRIALYGLGTLFNVYSSRPGPERFTPEARAAMRRSRLEAVARLERETGHKMPPEVAAAIGRAHKGRKHAEGHGQRIWEKRRENGTDHAAQKNPRAKGYRLTSEHVANAVAGRAGYAHSEEAKAAIKASKARNKTAKDGRYVGLTWISKKSCWQARLMVDQKSKFLGTFKDKEKAARAYDDAHERLHGTRPNATQV